jgi:hypothetical protein
LLPANKLWLDTGLTVAPGKSISIKATGAINLSLPRLVEAAEGDTRPVLPWFGPGGSPLRTEIRLFARRSGLLIAPDADYGTLLAYIAPAGGSEIGNRRVSPIVRIGTGGVISCPASYVAPGTLYLCVNDTVIRDDPESKALYIADQELLDEAYKKKPLTIAQATVRWEKLVGDEYWNVWFDDNIGHYLVEVIYE